MALNFVLAAFVVYRWRGLTEDRSCPECGQLIAALLGEHRSRLRREQRQRFWRVQTAWLIGGGFLCWGVWGSVWFGGALHAARSTWTDVWLGLQWVLVLALMAATLAAAAQAFKEGRLGPMVDGVAAGQHVGAGRWMGPAAGMIRVGADERVSYSGATVLQGRARAGTVKGFLIFRTPHRGMLDRACRDASLHHTQQKSLALRARLFC